MKPQTIGILINGEPITISAESTIAQLLDQLKVKSRAIAVELNQEVLPSHRFDQQILRPNDSLEIVTLAGGG